MTDDKKQDIRDLNPSAFMRMQDSIKHMHEHKETYEPRNIAREALAKLEG